MRRILPQLVLAMTAVLLAACSSPTPVWNEDGRTMTDLRARQIRGRQSVELTPGVMIYADAVRFIDKRKQQGEATGRVFLEVGPGARYKWLLDHGYADSAVFDRKGRTVVLKGRPIAERDLMTMIATEDYTTIGIRWDNLDTDVVVAGPTRTDFAKSHPIPPGALAVTSPPPRAPAGAYQRRTSLMPRK